MCLVCATAAAAGAAAAVFYRRPRAFVRKGVSGGKERRTRLPVVSLGVGGALSDRTERKKL